MREILIFSGTSEGRVLAGKLAERGFFVTVCVATDYGQEVMGQEQKNPFVQVRIGRMDVMQMEQLIGSKPWYAVVDATHPFAEEVTKNIRKACANQKKHMLRLLRKEEVGQEDSKETECSERDHPETECHTIENLQKEVQDKVVYVNSTAEAVSYLNQTTGRIFLTTGSKELEEYIKGIRDNSRLYVRILPIGAEVDRCRRLGLKGRQIICMQGPFREELNAAMLCQIGASFLVTKETSNAGGFLEKLKAAEQTGAQAVIIRRPKEHGYSMEEVLDRLGMEEKLESQKRKRSVTLAGIGMGNPSNMTKEVYDACENSDLIIGAARMLETVKYIEKPMKNLYRCEEVIQFLEEHPNYQQVVVLLSGDIGFYSGAKKLLQALAQAESYQIRLLSAVPSVAYFASRLGMCWEDLPLCSVHGRRQNLVGILKQYGRLFTLTDGAKGVQRISRELLEYGFAETEMYVGCQLSYPEEEIQKGTPGQFLGYSRAGVCVVILSHRGNVQAPVTHGIPDKEFLRDNVPMTKEEVRSVSLSKLALTREAVVYDIGSGTGSIAVECARQAIFGNVYAIEKNSKALELIKKNQYRHQVQNLEVIPGEAPQALWGLKTPTHAFIGGGGGKLNDIAEVLWKKNPGIRMVLNVVSLETLKEVMELMEQHTFSHKEVVQVSVAKARELGRHQLMMGQNPVYVITLQK